MVNSFACGFAPMRDKMIGPPNVAWWTGLGSLDDGYPITNADLDGSANGKRTIIRKDDFVLVRNGFRNSTSGEGTGAVMHIARRAVIPRQEVPGDLQSALLIMP